MDTSAQTASLTAITMRLQRRTRPLHITSENQETINFAAQAYQPNLRSLQIGAEALTADFKVESLGGPPEEYTYRTTGFGKDDRLSMGPLSTAERERLQDETTPAVSRYVLNAITALT
ncbi:MAG: hypothetical protein ACRDAP_08590, partial [Shewanella sp.]